MLVVKTKLKEFECKGIGLVALEHIKKWQKVWVYNPVIDLLMNKRSIPKEAESFYEEYAVEYEKNRILLSMDNARFINHSKNPNTKSLGYNKPNLATRDINIGEEITIDYATIDVNPIGFKVSEKSKA